MAIADATVRYFHSNLVGAPVLSGQAGGLINVLDACLVNGWGSITLDSLVVAGSTATATKSAGHTFEAGQVITVGGATPSGLNRDWRIAAITGTTFTFDSTGITTGTATGTITAKVAPAGWTILYTGTNLRVYQRPDITATTMLLRVDDTVTRSARAVMYESMSSINTGVTVTPTVLQQTTSFTSLGGEFWPKADATTSAARPWSLFANSKIFYMSTGWYSAIPTGQGLSSSFGDITTVKTSDAYNCMLLGLTSDVTFSGTILQSPSLYNPTAASTAGHYVARAYTQLGGAAQASFSVDAIGGSNVAVSGSFLGMIYPNPADGGLYLSPLRLYENNTQPYVYRGTIPGVYYVAHSIPTGTFNCNDIVVGVTGSVAGRRLMAITGGINVGSTVLIDVTGPWA